LQSIKAYIISQTNIQARCGCTVAVLAGQVGAVVTTKLNRGGVNAGVITVAVSQPWHLYRIIYGSCGVVGTV
jgi:hypothetical protein